MDEYLVHSASRCFIVTQNQHAVGLITESDLRKVPRDNWPQTSLQSTMRPLSQIRTVQPDTPAVQGLDLLNRENLNQLAVVSNGELQGIFSRIQLVRFLQIHSGLGKDRQGGNSHGGNSRGDDSRDLAA